MSNTETPAQQLPTLTEQMAAAPYGSMIVVDTTGKGPVIKALKWAPTLWLNVQSVRGAFVRPEEAEAWADTWPVRIVTPDLSA